MPHRLLALALCLLPGCLMYPNHRPIATDAEPLALDFEGRSLRVFYQRLGEGEPELVVLALTGNAGRAERMVDATDALLDRPAHCYAMQYPGFGEDTEGASGIRVSGRAAVACARWVRARHPDAVLWIHGLSIGTVHALHAARALGDDAVRGLILEKPPNLRSLILGEFGWWNLWLIAGPYALCLPTSARSDRNAAAIGDIPTVVVLAADDRVVPHEYSLEVYRALSGPKLLIDADGGHNARTTLLRAPMLGSALRWLWRQREP